MLVWQKRNLNRHTNLIYYRRSFIEYAVQQKLEIVEVFKFKSSDFVITLSQDSFKQNLQNVYEYYIATEKYELCARVKELEFQLNIISYQVNLHEKK